MGWEGGGSQAPQPRGDEINLDGRLALSIPEAAKALGVSERHLRDHLTDIPHVRIGGRVVVPVDAAREWLRDRARSTQDASKQIVDDITENMLK